MTTAVAAPADPKPEPPKLASMQLAERLGLNPADMVEVLKAQCFAGKKPEEITKGQLYAFINIANAIKVNPILPGMLYAYPIAGGGIIPMIGPDGVFKTLSEHESVDTWDVELHHDDKGVLVSATAIIFMRDGRGPRKKKVYLAEWIVPTNPNWRTRPHHMLEVRALKQCARQVIHGLPFDEDERRMMSEADQATVVEGEIVGGTPAKVRERIAARKPAAAVAQTAPPTLAETVNHSLATTQAALEAVLEAEPVDEDAEATMGGDLLSGAPEAEPDMIPNKAPAVKTAEWKKLWDGLPAKLREAYVNRADEADGQMLSPAQAHAEAWKAVLAAYAASGEAA